MAAAAQNPDDADCVPPALVAHRRALAYEFLSQIFPDFDAKVKRMRETGPPDVIDNLCQEFADDVVKDAQKRRLAESIDDDLDRLVHDYVGRELRLSC